MGLPTGGVTFLFSDVEGSTRLAQSMTADDWLRLLEVHDQLVDAAVRDHGGEVVKHEGDGAFAAFGSASDAVDAAVALSAALAGQAWPDGVAVRVRVGIHTGEGRLTSDGRDYAGIDVHYAARVAGAGNGGQIVLSDAARRGLDRPLPARASTVSAGRYRLKDFDEPLELHRLIVPGVADDPRPLRGTGGADLPRAVTSFVGRAHEVEAVAALLADAQIVTLTGPGGTGKTRLAVRVAETVRDRFADGVVFVELAPLRDPDLAAAAIAAAIGVTEVPGRPVLEEILRYLASRALLLVLDNLEQLLPDAASLVARLGRGASGLRILISSREPLRIAGEQEYPVPPLSDAAAETLFVDRARLVRPDFSATGDEAAAIPEITRQLGGLPLAIELAAARVKVFPPTRILERLSRSLDLLTSGARDLPERQRTLRATVAWSYDLLTTPEQALFRRLAVLVGDWTAESAEAIAGDAGSGLDVLDGLTSLVDKSLVRVVPSDHAEVRFGRHAFIREFALEMLDASGERAELERRHGEVFRDLAVRAGAELTEARAERSLDAIDHAIFDLREAMSWSLETGETEVGLRIVGSIWRWWQLRTHLDEGRDWAARLLSHPASRAATPSRVAALSAAGGLAYWSMDYAAARAAYAERLALAQGMDDRRQLAEAHYDMSFMAMVDRDLDRLRDEAEQAFSLYEEVGDRSGMVRARQALVLAHYLAGDARTALALEQQNLADFRSTQSSYRVADSLMLLGAIHRLDGDPAAAVASGREALASMAQLVGGSTIGVLGLIAVVEGESGDARLAARLTGAIRAVQAETGEALAPVTVLHLPDPAAVVRERLGSGPAEVLMAEGAHLSLEEAIELAMRGSADLPTAATD